MLVEFKFSNFKSFRDEVVFSMEPLTSNGKITNSISLNMKSAPSLYRTAAVFGPNASGKSNFVAALEYMQSLVIHSFANSINSIVDIFKYDRYQPYKLSGDINKPIELGIRFIIQNRLYRYQISILSGKVIQESLFVTDPSAGKKEKKVFVRHNNEVLSSLPEKNTLKKLIAETIDTRLALSDLINNRNYRNEYVLDAYNYIAGHITIITPSSINTITENLETLINLNGFDDLEEMCSFLQRAGIDIYKLEIKNNELFSFRKDERNQEVPFEFLSNESKGTITLLCMVFFMLPKLNGANNVIVIDELDSSLHPLLVQHVVDMFNNQETNPQNTQLVFTSHAHYLMNGNTLTRDQIWFTAKENEFCSTLYPLSDFKEMQRRNAPYYNEYIHGLFGALPDIREY